MSTRRVGEDSTCRMAEPSPRPRYCRSWTLFGFHIRNKRLARTILPVMSRLIEAVSFGMARLVVTEE